MCPACCCITTARERVPALLQKLRLSHGAIQVHGTPRRLAVLVQDLAPAQTPQESKVGCTAS
jgi:glycyl-tRNA synthetase